MPCPSPDLYQHTQATRIPSWSRQRGVLVGKRCYVLRCWSSKQKQPGLSRIWMQIKQVKAKAWLPAAQALPVLFLGPTDCAGDLRLGNSWCYSGRQAPAITYANPLPEKGMSKSEMIWLGSLEYTDTTILSLATKRTQDSSLRKERKVVLSQWFSWFPKEVRRQVKE